jgi:hypothetical protein
LIEIIFSYLANDGHEGKLCTEVPVLKSFVDRWRGINQDPEKSWVLFRNGTCVILRLPEGDLAALATELMKEWGPVYVGTPAADFNVIDLAPAPGWIVTCHHQDILTYVSHEEMMGAAPNDLMVGLLGRLKRDRDAQELEIIHIEDKRAGSYGLESRGSCDCLANPQDHLVVFRELGMDSRFAEVSILVCRDCGQHWLRYFYEVEAFTASARWYLGPITAGQSSSLSAEEAKSILEGLSWYYYGGSYFYGRSGKSSGPILLNP